VVNLRYPRPGRRGPIAAFCIVLAAVVVSVAGVASAAENTDLYDPDVRIADGFYPCPGQTNFTRGPLVEECYDANYQPLLFPVVTAPTSCNPADTSTIHVDRTTGSAFVPSGTPWLNGSAHWELTATIDQQAGPAAPEIQPFPNDGARMGSFGLPTGALTLDGTVEIDTNNDSTADIVADVSSLPNAGNWGVCRTFAQQPSGGDPGGGTSPITGDFYLINAGVLSYHVTTGPAGLFDETGQAEAYFSNALATCCNSTPPAPGNPPEFVSPATGHFRLQFGTTHPATGTSGTASTPTGSNVTVSNFVGANEDVGGVSLTFDSVTTAGDTSVTLLTDVPEPTSGFQVGVPPAVYDISTEAGFPEGSTIKVCLPYGSLPAGAEPKVFHFQNGGWEDVTITDPGPSGPPDFIVCGRVSSLSPFAVGYYTYNVSGPFQPVDRQPTRNTMKAGRTVPVKFSLGGSYGLDVFASGYPVSQLVNCDSGVPTDTVETTTSNPSGLTYDAASGTYVYSWKTSSSWKGQCRTLILQFSDGQELRADFKFS
jgi:hypothetical protein